jgi:enterochelin esterase family protein
MLVNGVTWLNDPLNPDHTGFEFDNSQLIMPEYVPPEEIEYHPDIPHGTIFDTNFYSTILENSRRVYIYMPPGYNDATDKYYPVILFHDGGSYYSEGLATNVLDNLIADKRICPVIAVFVPPVQRELEYAFDLTQEFESFIGEELMPYIDSEFRTRADPRCRAMAGSSFGGLISAQICYDRPEEFGLCATYSPAFWPYNFTVFFNIIAGSEKNIKFYVDWGTHERLHDIAIIFKNNLLYKSYEVVFNEWHDGHNLGNWRAHLDNMLEYFFPFSMGTTDANSRPVPLVQCYPNPVSHTARIEYQLDVPGYVKIVVCNQIGEQVAIISDEYQQKGMHYLDWDAEGLPSGMYYLRVLTESTGKSIQAKALVIRQ